MEEKETTRITKRCIPGVILVPKNGYWQIRQIGLTAQRVKKDPAFKRTRQHASEFALAVKTGKTIRDVLLPGTGIKKVAPRLTALLVKALEGDEVNIRGHRNLFQGNWSLLEGFECNVEAPLAAAINMKYEIIHGQDQVMIRLPFFIPADVITAPEGVGYCRLFVIAASLDQSLANVHTIRKSTTLIPLKKMHIPEQTLKLEIRDGKDKLHLLAMGMEWYSPCAGKTKWCRNDMSLPLAILSVWKT